MDGTRAAPAAAELGVALTGEQRVRLRVLLEQNWRDQLAQITELSMRLHSAPEAQPGETSAAEQAMVRELAAAHHSLREIEAALGRLETGRFGACEACRTEIPWERLEALPHGRFCARCHLP